MATTIQQPKGLVAIRCLRNKLGSGKWLKLYDERVSGAVGACRE